MATLDLGALGVTSFETAAPAASVAYSQQPCDSPLCGPSEMPTGCTDT